MSQRNSGYDRKPLDLYSTPTWVTESLLGYIDARPGTVWECAAGPGAMVRVLTGRFVVLATDVAKGEDFLQARVLPDPSIRTIITNPPYKLADQFVRHALQLTRPFGGAVAMLLSTNFDHAGGRADLFRDCPAWSRKIMLTRRIVWFVEANGKPKSSPSENHAWFVWDWRHAGEPRISYAP